MSASKDLFEGIDIYASRYKIDYHYYYSLLFAMAIYPLHYLGQYWSSFFWLLLSIMAFHRTWSIFGEYFPAFKIPKWGSVFYIISFLFALRFVRDNIHVGQITILIFYLTIEGLHQIQHGNNWKGVWLLALGINIKLLPIVFIPYLVIKGKYKVARNILLVCVLLLIIPVFIIGWEGYSSQMTSFWKLTNPTKNIHILDVDERSFHSLTTLLSTLFYADTADPYTLEIRRYIVSLPLESVKWVIHVGRFIIASSVFLIVKPPLFQSDKNNFPTFQEWAYLLLIIPLIFPHQQHYAFYFSIPAFMVLLHHTLQNKGYFGEIKSAHLVLLMMIFTLSTLEFYFGMYREYYSHFKILTYGALLMLIWSLISLVKRNYFLPK